MMHLKKRYFIVSLISIFIVSFGYIYKNIPLRTAIYRSFYKQSTYIISEGDLLYKKVRPHVPHYVNVLGGFGVLNADGEWNDSRESLFSELIIQYGKLLDKPEYIERGYAALKASFVMMYCTENPQTKQQWEKVHINKFGGK